MIGGREPLDHPKASKKGPGETTEVRDDLNLHIAHAQMPFSLDLPFVLHHPDSKNIIDRHHGKYANAYADRESPDQTAQMRSLIRASAVRQ